MQKRRFLALLVSLLLILGLFTACGKTEEKPVDPNEENQIEDEAVVDSDEDEIVEDDDLASTEDEEDEADDDASEEGSLSLTDMTGREIILDGPATKIVALTAADCEILYALGAGDALVGRGEYCDYPPEVLEVTSVESGMETNIEQIIELGPDVLLMSTMAQSEEQVKGLEDAGIKVVVSDAHDIEGVYQAIELIGSLMNKDDQALDLIDGMKSSFEEVSEGIEGLDGESIYFEISPLEYGLWTAGNNTFMDEVANMIGLKNAFEDVEGWGEVSEEEVLDRNPDFILTIAMYFGEGPEPIDEILARDGWGDIEAVKNESILNLQNEELSRPGPRLADGAKLLYDFVVENLVVDN